MERVFQSIQAEVCYLWQVTMRVYTYFPGYVLVCTTVSSTCGFMRWPDKCADTAANWAIRRALSVDRLPRQCHSKVACQLTEVYNKKKRLG